MYDYTCNCIYNVYIIYSRNIARIQEVELRRIGYTIIHYTLYISMYVYVSLSLYIYIYTYTLYVYIHIYIYIYMYVCIYIYIYIYISFTYTHIHMHPSVARRAGPPDSGGRRLDAPGLIYNVMLLTT